MFSDKFKGLCVKDLVCEICEKTKHQQHSYFSENRKKKKSI